MTTWVARIVIRLSAVVVPASLRARWREEWLAEIEAAPGTWKTVMRVSGAPWDAVTSRWTTRSRTDGDRTSWLVSRGDVKHAYRSLRRTPWYALTVASVIALTMALTTTVFAIVDGVLFKPLPYRDVGRFFAVSTAYSKVPDSLRSMGAVSQVDVDAWREALPEVRFTAFYTNGYLATGTDETVPSNSVDANFFDVIGLQPLTGGFEPGDFVAATKVRPALIAYGYWRRRFALDPSVVGRTFTGEGGVGFRVVGILPPDFIFPSYWGAPDALTPRVAPPASSRGGSLNVLARLPATLSEPEASARLTAAAKRLAATWPAPPPPVNVLSERQRLLRGHFDAATLQPIRDALTEVWSATYWIAFWAAMALVLLASVNVAGLALARLQDRWRELALRRSLGARYADLVRLLAVEYALVIGAGTVAGVLVARTMLDVTVSLMSKSAQFLKTPAMDVRVLLFAALTAAVCVVLLTLVSARAAWRSSLRSAIVEGGATTRRLRRGMSIVSIQVALALVMAVGGALVAGSLLRVYREDPGFDVSRTALVKVGSRVPMPASDIEDLMDGLRHLPGIEHAGGVARLVLEHAFSGNDFRRPAGVMLTTTVESMPVTAGYLEAAGLAPIDGRLPTASEFLSGAPVVVVSDIVAHQYWPGRRAVGQSLVHYKGREFSVVGVVPDARYMALDMEPQGAIYLPFAAQVGGFPGRILITFTRDRRASFADVTTWFVQHCPTCRPAEVQMLTDALDVSIRTRRFNAWLFSSFGLAALVIVGTGILGLVAMTTNRRTREIGIRMALGATRPGVVRQILREQVTSVVAGLLMGGLIAAWAVRFVSAYLYKTPIYDGWAWAAAIAALLAVSLLGGLVPSVRASRVDPVQALRAE